MSVIDYKDGFIAGLEKAAKICEQKTTGDRTSMFAHHIRKEARFIELKFHVVQCPVMPIHVQGELFQ